MTALRRRSRALPGPVLSPFLILFAFFGVAAATPPATQATSPCGDGVLCPGDRIEAANLAEAGEKTFAGHKIADLMPERLVWQIREEGLAVTLAPYKAYPGHDRHREATRRYAGDVVFDPTTNGVSGYKAGVPFPDLSPDDPHIAAKVIWNLIRGRDRGDTFLEPLFTFVLIDGRSGVERVQHWGYRRFGMKGLLRGDTPVLGDGTIWEKDLLFSIAPQDIKGLGTFTIRYDDGRPDDKWAYIREVRRTRRLTGSTWMDPLGGTDFVTDDVLSFNAHPTWYKEFRYLGKTTVLGIANSRAPFWNPGAASHVDQFPGMNVASAPYWNLVDHWEPRTVHVVEAVPPVEHPYSRRVLHIDAETWNNYFSFMYNRAGNHWKSFQLSYTPWPLADRPGQYGSTDIQAAMIDFRNRHATAFMIDGNLTMNAGVAEDDVSLAALETLGR